VLSVVSKSSTTGSVAANATDAGLNGPRLANKPTIQTRNRMRTRRSDIGASLLGNTPDQQQHREANESGHRRWLAGAGKKKIATSSVN